MKFSFSSLPVRVVNYYTYYINSAALGKEQNKTKHIPPILRSSAPKGKKKYTSRNHWLQYIQPLLHKRKETRSLLAHIILRATPAPDSIQILLPRLFLHEKAGALHHPCLLLSQGFPTETPCARLGSFRRGPGHTHGNNVPGPSPWVRGQPTGAARLAAAIP